eukprot:CFRG4477T1
MAFRSARNALYALWLCNSVLHAYSQSATSAEICNKNKADTTCVVFANNACHTSVAEAMSSFTPNTPIELWIIQSNTLSDTVQNDPTTQRSIIIHGCAGVEVTCISSSIGIEGFNFKGEDDTSDRDIEHVMFDGFTIQNCTGRGLDISAKNITIQNMVVLNNGNENNAFTGAGVNLEGISALVSNCTFIGNQLKGSTSASIGAGLFLGNVVNGTVKDSTFEANFGGSGAVGAQKTFTIQRCSFIGNTCGKNGCAILANERVYIFDTLVDGNSQWDAPGVTLGGAIFARSGIETVNLTCNNNYGGVGGCFFLNEDSGTGIFRNSTFNGNSALELAGVGNSNGNLEFHNCEFNDNFCDYASVVYCQADLVVTGSTLKRNRGVVYGALTADSGVLIIDDCVFEDNIAAGNAAALNTFVGDITIKNSVFRNNSVVEEWFTYDDLLKDPSGALPGVGGVITCAAKLTVNDTTFELNHAFKDGGVARAGETHFNRVQAYDNSAGAFGGVLHARDVGLDIFIVDSVLSGNTAGDSGGAIYSQVSSVFVNNSTLAENAAEKEGGAVWAAVSATITDSIFICNRASYGSGVSVEGVLFSVLPPNISTSFMNNSGKKCTALYIGDGLVCDDNLANTCVCKWAQETIKESCGANGQCVSTDSGALSCECGLDEWYSGEKCVPCSSCGATGISEGACTSDADTMCTCPPQLTGENCTIPCELPKNCTAGDISTCMFNALNYGYNSKCEKCEEGFFVDEVASCTKCATCGIEGVPEKECSATSNTVCICPLGKTGEGCKESCEIPLGCLSVTVDTTARCQFSLTDFSKGVECLSCEKGFFMDMAISQCKPVSVCNDNQFAVSSATDSSDTECQDLTVCDTNSYEVLQPTAVTDRVCAICSPASGCLSVTAECTSTSNIQCSACTSGRVGASCSEYGVTLTTNDDYDTWTDESGHKLAESMAISLEVPLYEIEYLSAQPGSVLAFMGFSDTAKANLEDAIVSEGTLPTNVQQVQIGSDPPVIISNESSNTLSTGVIVAIAIVVILALLAFGSAMYCMWSRHAMIKATRQKTVDEVVNDIRKQYKWLDHNDPSAQNKLDSVGRAPGWLPRNQFALLDILGKGAFGQVCRGVVFVEGTAVVCAIKQLLQGDDESNFQQASDDFLREAQLLKELDHRNVVRMIGVSMDEDDYDTQDVPSIYMLLEYMDLGDLRKYMQTNTTDVTLGERLWFCREISAGLAYLATIPVVHRDIAARNVLLRSNPRVEGFPYAKISDMGLARLTAGTQQNYVKQSEGGILPVRWMAPETLSAKGIYTEASDVWAFGVCTWEVFSNGTIPYDFCDNSEFIAIQRHAQLRLNKPEACTVPAYDTMTRCWHAAVEDRPTFGELAEIYDNLFFQECPNYKDYDEFEEISDSGSNMDEVRSSTDVVKMTKSTMKKDIIDDHYAELTMPHAIDVEQNDRENYNTLESTADMSSASLGKHSEHEEKVNYDTLDNSTPPPKEKKISSQENLYVEVKNTNDDDPVDSTLGLLRNRDNEF